MFEFLYDQFNYAERAVDRFEDDGLIIDTCQVSDGENPYETGILCTDYHESDWIIVEAYATKELAQKGHDLWVQKMTSKNPPETLIDCNNAKLSKIFPENSVYKRKNFKNN